MECLWLPCILDYFVLDHSVYVRYERVQFFVLYVWILCLMHRIWFCGNYVQNVIFYLLLAMVFLFYCFTIYRVKPRHWFLLEIAWNLDKYLLQSLVIVSDVAGFIVEGVAVPSVCSNKLCISREICTVIGVCIVQSSMCSL